MALVPVFCDDCGAVFGTTSFIGGDARGITMIGNKVGPCPACGGMGSVPDGVYDLVGDTLQIVKHMGDTPPDVLERLMEILRAAARTEATPEEVTAQVQAEVPQATPIITAVIQQSGGHHWQQWLLILLTVLQALFGYLAWQESRGPEERAAESTTLDDQDVERIAQRVAEELRQHPLRPEP